MYLNGYVCTYVVYNYKAVATSLAKAYEFTNIQYVTVDKMNNQI